MANFEGHVKMIGSVESTLLQSLRDRVGAIQEEEWAYQDSGKPNRFSVFDQAVQHIVLQFPLNLQEHRLSAYLPIWHDYQDLVKPVVESLAPSYGYNRPRTSRIMFARLLPGKAIEPHVDGSLAAVVPNKIHVPLFTSPEVSFTCETQEYHLETGIIYEVNNAIIHGGYNRSSIPRVHLIFDYFDLKR